MLTLERRLKLLAPACPRTSETVIKQNETNTVDKREKELITASMMRYFRGLLQIKNKLNFQEKKAESLCSLKNNTAIKKKEGFDSLGAQAARLH